jgi:formate-dependent nitrite reductase cytochrome c552 subunit
MAVARSGAHLNPRNIRLLRAGVKQEAIPKTRLASYTGTDGTYDGIQFPKIPTFKKFSYFQHMFLHKEAFL